MRPIRRTNLLTKKTKKDMKYIKLYEDINLIESNKYFQSITIEEFYEYFNRQEDISFNETDKKIINKLDKHNGYSFLPFFNSIEFKLSSIPNILGYIHKLKDEWFLIEMLIISDDNKIASHKNLPVKKLLCYKCDQIEGVIFFLNSLIKNNDENVVLQNIKLYENINFENNKYYHTITPDEFYEFFSEKENLRFDERDKKILYELDKYNDYSFKPLLTSCIEFDLSTKPNIAGHIYKLKDEWFLIEIQLIDKSGHYVEQTNYYKCDQMEGLIHFLKTIKNKI